MLLHLADGMLGNEELAAFFCRQKAIGGRNLNGMICMERSSKSAFLFAHFPRKFAAQMIAADGICENFAARASFRAAVALLAAVALPLE